MRKSLLFSLLSLLFIPNILWAFWAQEGSALNISSSQIAGDPSIAIAPDGTPYVVWQESNGTATQINVKYWAGDWYQLGGSLNVNPSTTALNPSLAISTVTGFPYVTWAEGATSQIYEKHWNGNAWQQDGGSLNVYAGQTGQLPSIAVYNGTPYISFYNSNGTMAQIYEKHWNGSAWQQDGGTGSLNLNSANNDYYSQVAVTNGIPYVAFSENGNIYEKHLNGSTWQQDGGSLNVSGTAPGCPSIAAYNNVPYVSWGESSSGNFQSYVKHFSSGAWVQDGNIWSGFGVSNLAIYNGMVYVGLGNLNQLFEAHWNGSEWQLDGGAINTDKSGTSMWLAVNNGIPYAAICDYVYLYVKHWTPDHISLVQPAYGLSGNNVNVSIMGTGFNGTPQAAFLLSGNTDFTSSGATQNNLYNFTYTVNLNGAAPNVYDVQVSTTDGCQSTLKEAFTVLSLMPGPVAWRVNDLGQAGTQTNISLPCGMDIGDADQQNQQKLYVANQDQTLYAFNWQTATKTWSCSPLTSHVSLDPHFGSVMLADGNGDNACELYAGSVSNNHLYQFQYSSAWQRFDLGSGASGTYTTALTKADFYNAITSENGYDGIAEMYSAQTAGGGSGLGGITYNGTSWRPAGLASTIPGIANALAAGDGNNDINVEIYAATQNGIYQLAQNVPSFMIGFGTDIMYGVAVGDGDNDGKNEVYGANKDGNVYLFRPTAGGGAGTSQVIGSVPGNTLYAVAISDGENNGTNQVYAACGNGHVYEFKYQSNKWSPAIDMGSLANTPLLAIAVGDADNDHHFEVYALGQNNHVYQFQAYTAPTATPTITATVTPTPTTSPVITATASLTPTPTATKAFIPDIDGKIISEKYVYCAPSPVRGAYANLVIYTKTPAEVDITLFTLANQECLSRRRNYSSPGKQTERIFIGDLANGVYIFLVRAKGEDGIEERVIKKIGIVK